MMGFIQDDSLGEIPEIMITNDANIYRKEVAEVILSMDREPA
jgi:hypothetical protein